MPFLILTVIVFSLIVIFIPKRLSGIEMVATSLFAVYFQNMVDNFLDLKYNLYGYFKPGVDWRTLLYLFGVYPAVNIVFLNFFPYNKTLIKKTIYVACWVIFSGIFELLFLWSKTFYYDGWKLWYSLVLYPFLFLTLIGFHKYVRYLLARYIP